MSLSSAAWPKFSDSWSKPVAMAPKFSAATPSAGPSADEVERVLHRLDDADQEVQPLPGQPAERVGGDAVIVPEPPATHRGRSVAV